MVGGWGRTRTVSKELVLVGNEDTERVFMLATQLIIGIGFVHKSIRRTSKVNIPIINL